MMLTLQKLAKQLELEYKGEAGQEIKGVASLTSADKGDLCFVQQEKYIRGLSESACSAALVPLNFDPESTSKSLIFAENPHFSFIQAISIIRPEPVATGDALIHESAQLSISAKLGANVSIGALTVIGNDVEIGEGTSIGEGCIVEDGARIGSHSKLHSRVSLGRQVIIGNRCIIQSGAVLGSEGFGLVFHQERWEKIPHIGTVVIEDDVEIGANTTIDRGALDNTLIEQGCKLDNLIQVAHNVRIGAHTAIAACVGIAGSANIGQYCRIGGGAGILGHLSIADKVTVTAMSLVTRNIKAGGVYSSGTPLMENTDWHKSNARYKALDRLARSVVTLEKRQSGSSNKD